MTEAWVVDMLVEGQLVLDPKSGRSCSRLSRRGQQQAGELLSDRHGLSGCSLDLSR